MRCCPIPVDYVPYTASHVVSQLQLLLFSGLAFFLMLGWLKRTLTITLDTDWFWRRLGPRASRAPRPGCRCGLGAADRRHGYRRLDFLGAGLHRHHGPDGILGRTWPTGTMALWATVMLGAYLVLSYVGGPLR